MIYNIVDGLSKLLCDPLPYLKTKKNDLYYNSLYYNVIRLFFKCLSY